MAMSAENLDTSAGGRARVGAASAAYAEIIDLLTDDTRLLDDDRYEEWLELTTDDMSYHLPQRSVVLRRDQEQWEAKERTSFFLDNKQMLAMRARRQSNIRHAYDRDPPPRVRRFISSITIWQGDNAQEYIVTSNVLALWNRLQGDTQLTLSGLREDVIRRTPQGMKLAKRRVSIDSATFDANFVNILL